MGNKDSLIPKLKPDQKQFCNRSLTIEECRTALKKLQNNKFPSPDGFTTNFYKFLWPDLKKSLKATYRVNKMVHLPLIKN